MAVSDRYVIDVLRQQSGLRGPVEWRRSASGTLTTQMNGVDIELESLPSSTGARVCVRLSRGDSQAAIVEPSAAGFLSRHYHSEDDEGLADAMRALLDEACLQCFHRESIRNADAEKELLFDQLLFGHEAPLPRHEVVSETRAAALEPDKSTSFPRVSSSS